MARPYTHERVQQLRDEGKGTHEINRIMAREQLEYEIADIEDISDVKIVLQKMLDKIVFF